MTKMARPKPQHRVDTPEARADVTNLRIEMAERLRDAAGEYVEDNVVDWAVRRALERVADAFEAGVDRG